MNSQEPILYTVSEIANIYCARCYEEHLDVLLHKGDGEGMQKLLDWKAYIPSDLSADYPCSVCRKIIMRHKYE